MTQIHPERCSDDSVNVASHANVNVNRFTLPKDARDLILAIVMSASLIALVIVSYLLHDAYRDIQTQIWLKQDKEEEKFQKFIAGPYAQLAGELKAAQILAKCPQPQEKGK
jgi:hypothetical protein